MTRFDTGNVIVYVTGRTTRASVVAEEELVWGKREREMEADPGGSSGSGSDAPVTPSTGERGYTG